MALDTQIPLLVKSTPIETPAQVATAKMTIADAQAKRQAVIDQAADKAALDTALKTHIGANGLPDYDGALTSLRGQPRAQMQLQTQMTTMRTAATKQHLEELDAHDKEAAIVAQMFQGVRDASGYQSAYGMLQRFDPQGAKAIGETYDPTVVQRLVNAGMSTKEFNDKERVAQEDLISGKFERGAASTLSLASSPEDWQNRLHQIATYAPKSVVEKWANTPFSPEAVKAAQIAALTPEQQVTREDKQEDNKRQAQAETRMEQRAQTQDEIARAQLSVSRGHLGIAQAELKLKQQTAAGAEGVTLKPGTPNYRQAQDLADGTLTFQDFQRLHSRAQADAPLRAAIYDTARQLNPNFNPSAFEIGFKFASNPKVRQQISSLKNVEAGVDDLLKFSDKASRSNIPVLNKALQLGGVNLGGKSYSNFQTAVTAFADELSGALGYGSATDMSREMGFKMTDLSQSPDTFRSNIENVVLPFVARKKASIVGEMGPYAGGANPTGAAPAAKPADYIYDPKTGTLNKRGG